MIKKEIPPFNDTGILPIRTQYVREIFTGQKPIEFRSYFPVNFRGYVFIYECGKDSRHKVVGYFQTPYSIKVEEDGSITHEKRFDNLPELYKSYLLGEANPTDTCIPIKNPVQFPIPLELNELDKKLNVLKPTEFPRGFRWIYTRKPFINPFKEK